MNFVSKKILISIFLFAFVASTSLYGKEKEAWQRFTAEKNNFSIDLPKKPEHIHQTITVPKSDMKIEYDTYISEPSDEIVYVISVWDYPDVIDMSKPEVNLQDGFGGMLSALPDSEVIEMNMTEIDGNKALEFLVKNEEIYFHGKLILAGNTLYQVFSVYKDKDGMGKSYDHFIDSFRLTSEGKKKEAFSKEAPGTLKSSQTVGV